MLRNDVAVGVVLRWVPPAVRPREDARQVKAETVHMILCSGWLGDLGEESSWVGGVAWRGEEWYGFERGVIYCGMAWHGVAIAGAVVDE
jgi:hypothetical protein